MHMGAGRGRRGFVVLVGGALAAGAVQAGAARALGDDEMAKAWGRGLDESTLQVLTRQDQSASYASADGAFTALATLTEEGAATLERQTARQQAQAATVGMQQTLRLAQTLVAATQIVAPLVGIVSPVMSVPGIGLPLPPAIGNDGKKH
jgi:hypothetical protein